MVSKSRGIKTLEIIEDLIDAICFDERCDQCAFYREKNSCIGVDIKQKAAESIKELEDKKHADERPIHAERSF